MKLKIACNKMAKNAFDFIFQIYCELNNDKSENSLECFSTPDKRKKIIFDFVLNNLKIFSNDELLDVSFYFEEYFLMEQLINLFDKAIDEKLNVYEHSLLNFKNNTYSITDFYIYQ